MKTCDLHISGGPSGPVISVNGGQAHPLPVFTQTLRDTLRWLIEDYPRLAIGVADTAARFAEKRLTEYGVALGQAITASAPELEFEDPDTAFMLRDPDGLTRHWPWELLSASNQFVTQSAAGLFRTSQTMSEATPAPRDRWQTLRILSVIARPKGVSDVGFRAVARRMLSNATDGAIEITVLRPPTLKALSEAVWQAAQDDQPFDVVHFDGHGDVMESMGGEVGAILFENARRTGARPASGRAVAKALSTGGVKMLLLNACHSAQAPLIHPTDSLSDHGFGSKAVASFAEEVAVTGEIDVVAMSHQLSVSNAVHIVDDLYRCLASGGTLPEAIRYARRRWLDGEPSSGSSLEHVILRAFVNQPQSSEIDKWPPYAPPQLANLTTAPAPGMVKEFQNPPLLFGTDDTILTLDRAFDDSASILLTGLKGAGKSETAREFGRWLVASGRLAASEVSLLYLGATQNAEDVIAQIASHHQSFLILEHGENLHGDTFQEREPWSAQSISRLSEALEARSVANKHTLILAHAPIPGLSALHEIPVRPMELEDLRDFARSRLQDELSDLLLLWTAGNPMAALTLLDYANMVDLTDIASAQSLLHQLRNGQFTDETLPSAALEPLLLKNLDIQSAEIAPAWFLIQFQGRFVFPVPELDADALARNFRRPYFAIFSDQTRPSALIDKLKFAGLIAEPVPGTLLLHPLLPAVLPHPYNCDPYRTDAALNVLYAAKGFAAQYLWLVSGETSKFIPEMGRSHPLWRWHVHSLHNAWYSIAGDEVTVPEYVLKLGRKVRVMLERLPDLNARQHLIDRMEQVFGDLPQDDSEKGRRLALDWANEQLSIAMANHDRVAARNLSKRVSLLESNLRGAASDDVKNNEGYTGMVENEASFDAHWKAGKVFVQDDPHAALQSFSSAFDAAGDDMARQALAALELARLTSTRSEVLDLETAEKCATLAYNLFFDLAEANLVDRGRVSEAALTASRILLEIARRDDTLEKMQNDGLSFAITARDYASGKKEEALAAYNLGNWLRMLRKTNAAEKFIEAASLFEEIGDERNQARAMLFYGVALFEREGREDALKPIHEARAIFERIGDKQGLELADVYLREISSALQ